MRPPKKNLALDTDSALSLMQEIYFDIVEQKNTATLIMKKMLSFMKDVLIKEINQEILAAGL